MSPQSDSDSPVFLSKNRTAFTLVEILVVIVIVGVLAAILLPVVSKMQDNAARVTDTASLKQIGVAISLFAGENSQYIPNNVTDSDTGKLKFPITGTATTSGGDDRWTFQESVDRYMGKMAGFNSSSIYNFYKRPKIWCSRMAKPYPGWTSSNGEPSPLAFSWNPNISASSNWQGSLLRIPGQDSAGRVYGPSKIVIVGEVNGSAGNMYPNLVATFKNNVDCRYRICRPGDLALYLFADFHIEGLSGDRGYNYYTSHPTEPNMWKWW